jgi:hypothetical protein
MSTPVDKRAQGKPDVIAEAVRPEVVALIAPDASQIQRLGFLKGKQQVPNDFDTMSADQIQQMFDGLAPATNS